MVKDKKVSGPSSAQYYTNPLSKIPHVLAHLLKSFRAYNVKSSSTLFLKQYPTEDFFSLCKVQQLDHKTETDSFK